MSSYLDAPSLDDFKTSDFYTFEFDERLADGKWHHVMVIHNGFRIRKFIDNELIYDNMPESNPKPKHTKMEKEMQKIQRSLWR